MDLRLPPNVGRVEHRHGDAWYPMEERSGSHRPSDAERDWAEGRIYHCVQCNEHIRIVHEDERR